MEWVDYKKCETCGKALATKIGGQQYNYCLAHCDENDLKSIRESIAVGACPESIFDASAEVDDYLYHSPQMNIPKEADFTGSLFSNIDFSSRDLTRVDFSFCSFDECDFRRTRLFNSSLLWAVFSGSLLRQVDINNSDCRWMCASAVKKECKNELLDCLTVLEKLAKSKSVHRMVKGWGKYFGLRYSVRFENHEVEQLNKRDFKSIKEGILGLKPNNDRCSEARTATDWSGSSLRGSDFAHANFDNAKVQETSFDGSDLHAASFRYSEMQRSVFTDVSFSREGQPPPCISNFDNAHMEECSFTGGNLSGLYFKHVHFTYSDFKNAHFDGAVFWDCDLRSINAESVIANNCMFFGSDLSGSSFLAATLNHAAFFLEENKTGLGDGCGEHQRLLIEWQEKGSPHSSIIAGNFQAAEMEGACMTEVRAQAVNMMAVNLKGARFCEAKCAGAQFESSDITGSNFEGAILTGCNMRDCDISGDPPIFSDTNLRDAVMSGMGMNLVEFIDCDMGGIVMEDCDLSHVIIRREKKDEINMRRSSLRGSSIAGLRCSNVNMDSSNMSYLLSEEEQRSTDDSEPRLQFSGCSIKSCNIEGSFLNDAKFERCNIKNSRFSNAHLEKVEYDDSDIDSCDFSGAELKSVTIRSDPRKFSAIDLSYAALTACSFCGTSKLKSGEASASTINLDYAEAHDLTLKHIYFASLSARFSNLKIVESNDVVFSSSDFSSASVCIEAAKDTHFFYDNFSSAVVELKNVSIDKHTSVFLGCLFSSAEIKDRVERIIFADCIFSDSNMLSSAKLVGRWSKAILVSPVLKNLKYCEEKNWLKDFLTNSRKVLDNEQTLLGATRQLQYRFDIAERLGTLIPKLRQSKRDEGYGMLKPLCRALKIDFRRQNLHDFASDAYVDERYCGIQLAARGTQCCLLKSFRMRCASISSGLILSFFAATWLFMFFYPSFWAWGAGLVALSVVPVFWSTFWRDLVGRHLYLHGESFLRIIVSALVVICFFSVCYHAFIPEFEGKKVVKIFPGNRDALNTTQGANDEFWVTFAPDWSNDPKVLQSEHLLAGGIKDGDVLLTRGSGGMDSLKKLFVCFYFSGVTFTTLGYGDVSPQGVVRVLAMAESGVGAFLIALFVFAYTRRDV